jgi:hypothetical protein
MEGDRFPNLVISGIAARGDSTIEERDGEI